VILLAGVPELPGSAVEGLEKRVRAGAGLVVFLGDRVKADFYNQRLYNPLQPSEGLLPVPLKASAGGVTVTGQAGLMTDIRWGHPLLTPLYDPVYGDLAKTRFERYAAFTAAPGAKDVVLARLDNEVPALIEHPLGAGRVLLFNTTADDTWGDLRRRRSYVPLLDRVLAYLSAGGVRHSFSAGEPITLPLPTSAAGAEVTVITPGGARRSPRLLTVGEQTFLHLDEVREPGVYRVEQAGQKETVFVVNVTRAQSALTPADGKTLQAWWSPTRLELLTPEAAARRLSPADALWPLWPALVLGAGLLLLLETVYVAVLCPRVNPAVVGSVVHRRGLLRPLNETPSEGRTAEPQAAGPEGTR
jgi:hypothetical protein